MKTAPAAVASPQYAADVLTAEEGVTLFLTVKTTSTSLRTHPIHSSEEEGLIIRKAVMSSSKT